MKQFLPVLIFFIFCNDIYGADIKLMEENIFSKDFGLPIMITGNIEKGDTENLLKTLRDERTIARLNDMPPNIRITSAGGDFEEALKMGKFIRASLLSVWAREYCYSACFVILMSSVEPRGDSSPGKAPSIGIHRPYYEKKYFSTLSMGEARKQYDTLERLTKLFLIEMDVPTNIIDKMFETSSVDNYLLNTKERSQVLRSKPAYEEWINSKCVSPTKEEMDDVWKNMISKTNFSKGYTDYLNDKQENYLDCIEKLTFNEFAKVLKEW